MSIIIDGLSLGAIYALIALGYTMVYGIAKMLNFAHGDIIMVGAYAAFATLSLTGFSALAVIVALVVCVALGITVERVAYRPLRSASPLAVLITAIGVSYFLQSVAQLIFGAQPHTVVLFSIPPLRIGETTISGASLLTLCLSVLLMIGLTLFVNRTRTGHAMLAVSEDRGAAGLMGINVNRIIMITFAIGSALAACASVFYLMYVPQVNNTLGAMPGIKAFTAAVIGGIGSIPGAMIGGVLLGVIETVCLHFPALSSFTNTIEFGLLIVILLFKPTGLLGKRRREKV